MNRISTLRKDIHTSGQHELKLTRALETGFPSPAGDHLEKALNLEELVVQRPAATFYVRVEGNSMKASGICEGDILVVDRSLHARNGDIIVAVVENEPLVRRLFKQQNRILLVTDSASYEPIAVFEETEWTVWGVVTHLIHRYRI